MNSPAFTMPENPVHHSAAYHGKFESIDNPDERVQYKSALKEILMADPLPQHSSNTLKIKTDGWLCVSVWRMAVLGTGDDRLQSGKSLIHKELKVWDRWLQENSGSGVQMLSVALLEDTSEETAVKQVPAFRKTYRFKRLQLAIRQFGTLRSVVDSVSPDMAAGHFLWVYKDSHPRFVAIHQGVNGTAKSLSERLSNIVNPSETGIFSEKPALPERRLSF